MIGVDDILDDAHWTNVQDPIRKMFLSLSKAIRAQSAGIRDLDKKYADLITVDATERLVRDNVNSCCSKQDATQLIYQIDTKAAAKDVAVLESRLEQANRTIDVLTNKLQDQSLVINDLTNKLDTVSHDVHALKNPNYEQIFSYIDRQVSNLTSDVDRKLAVKADHTELNTCIPQRLEDLYRSMNVKINEMKVDITRCATKDDFQILANNKADGSEIRELAHELKDCVTHHDLHQQVVSQINPLVTAMSSLEKAIQIQDISTKHTQSTFTDKMQTLERLYREYIDHKASNDEHIQAALNKDKLCTLVEEIMHLRRWGEVTPSTVDSAVQQQTEYLLNKMGIMGESIRLEVVTSTREEFNSIQHQMDQKISDVSHLAKEISEKHMKTRKAVKELSLNVATALSKKVDLKDYKSHLQHQPQHQSTSSLSSGAGGGGGARGNYQSVVNQSRSLLNTSQDNNLLSSAAESDPNREFDFLLQSMRSDTNRGRYHDVNNTSRSHRYSSSGNELSDQGEEVDSLEDRKGRDHHVLNQSHASRGSTGVRRGHSSSPLRRSRGAHFHPEEPLRNSFGTGHPAGAALRSTSATRRSKAETDAVEVLQKTVYSLSKEVEQIKTTLQQHLANRPTAVAGFNPTLATANDIDKLDWRLALGEISMNLRREVADKASREELFTVLRTEVEAIDRKLSAVQKGVDAAAVSTDLVKLETDFTILRNRVAGELTGARFLWTSGQVMTDGWLPWDVQVINVAPSIIAWKKNTTGITVKVPGLYHINISVFTTLPTILQVFLNDEPLFSYQPDSMDNSSSQNSNPNIQKNEKYTLRRLRHSVGEVSSISINEHVSLPAEANLMVRYHAGAPAQAFFAIKKL